MELNDHLTIPIYPFRERHQKSNDQILIQAKWRRFNHPPWILIRPDPQPTDIVQGLLGNCWLLSALTLVVQHRQLFEKVFPSSNRLEFQRFGQATIRLFHEGKWIPILVDDWLPCDQQGKLIFAEAKRNQLFVPLVEKAMAKLLGGYNQLVGGHTSKALTALTGYPCELISIPTSITASSDDPLLELWLKLISYQTAGFLMSISCGENNEDDGDRFEMIGLLPDHAYSILDVMAIGNVRLVKLRNPWGNLVWNGDWSESSPLWTSKLGRQLSIQHNKHDNAQQGVFWMSFEDVCQYFDDLIVCKIRHNEFAYCFEGQFPITLHSNSCLAPKVFEVCIEATRQESSKNHAQLAATLYQAARLKNRTIMVIVFELLASHTAHVLGSLVGASACASQASITCEAEIKQGRRYLLATFAFHHDRDQDGKSLHSSSMSLAEPILENYVLRINSTRLIKVTPVDPNPALKGDLIIDYVRARGKLFPKQSQIFTYHLNRNWPGLVTVIENHHTHLWLQVSMKCRMEPITIAGTLRRHRSTSSINLIQENLVQRVDAVQQPTSSHDNIDDDSNRLIDDRITTTSRGMIETIDWIGPGQCQLINMLINWNKQMYISIVMDFKFHSKFNLIDDHQMDPSSFGWGLHHPPIHANYGWHSSRPIR